MNSLAAALEVTPEVEHNAGFTLVENDDVAFSLSVCREIYRIYGTYQDGELAATEAVQAGLVLTMQMFTTLQNTVTDGMPALRIEVAAAQTREMMAALFGQGLPSRRMGTASPDRSRNRGRQANPPLAAPNGNGSSVWSTPRSLNGHHKELPEVNGAAASALAPASPHPPTLHQPAALGPAATPAQAYLRDRWYGFWRRRTLTVRVLATVLGCCLVAVLIDVPFTILAIFPNLLIPLTVAFAGADVARLLYRTRRPRRQFWSPATERGAARTASIVTSFGIPSARPEPPAAPSGAMPVTSSALTAGVPQLASPPSGSAGRESEFHDGFAKPAVPLGQLVVGHDVADKEGTHGIEQGGALRFG